MISGSLARRYARAVFSIGVDQGNYEAIGREVADLARTMVGSPELTNALTNPVFSRDQRRRLLDRIMVRLGCSKITRNFGNLLLDRERIVALPDIARELARMIDDKANRVRATVTSARPLTPTQIERLQLSLEKLSGKQVEMQKQEDPALLGGVVAQVGDVLYDGSLRTQLARMRDSLVK